VADVSYMPVKTQIFPTRAAGAGEILKKTPPAPACCLDIEMAGEESWNKANARNNQFSTVQ
jgi:hypothetical protein